MMKIHKTKTGRKYIFISYSSLDYYIWVRFIDNGTIAQILNINNL